MGTYEKCPMAYKFSYIDKIKGGNMYTEIGLDVHSFIEDVFKVVKPNIEKSKLDNIGELKLTPNLEYKKNVLLLEANRWRNICFEKIVEKEEYFKPIIEEEMLIDEKNMIKGIVDRVHKCHIGDAFAPDLKNFPQFQNGDLVIVENKTGTYTKQKSIAYEVELLWYRMLIRASKGIDIRWGAIYYPKNNKIHYVDLNDEKFNEQELLKKINKVRGDIDKGIFKAKPSNINCPNCFHNDICEYRK